MIQRQDQTEICTAIVSLYH